VSVSAVSVRLFIRPTNVYYKASRVFSNHIDVAVDESSGKCHIAIL